MKTLIFLLLLCLLFLNSSCKVLCPRQCICDLKEQNRRVSCEGKNLLDILNVPREVNILSLRGNVIQKIENYCFQNTNYKNGFYTLLYELDLSENHISDLEMYAFRGLDKLEKLNLSRNRLEKVINNVFIYNELLRELDLSYNNFVSLQDEPFIQHKRLEVLDLSNTQLVQLFESTFQDLPSLEVLSLDGNNLVRLHISVLTQIPHLKSLSLNENNWRCNLDFDLIQNWLLKNRIEYKTQCRPTKKSEKIMMLYPVVEIDRGEEDLKEKWNLNNREEEFDEKQLRNTTNTGPEETEESFLELFNSKFPSLWSLIIGLQIGFLIGIIFTYILMTASCRKPRNFQSSHRRRTNNRNLLLSRPIISHTDTPPIVRRQMSTSEMFPRSTSWETTSFSATPPPVPRRMILQDINEMISMRPETPPPAYAECSLANENNSLMEQSIYSESNTNNK